MHIVTVVNGIGETSMPYNEFILYKSKNNPETKQTVLVCSAKIPETVERPDNIKVKVIGTNPFLIRKTVKEIVAQAKKSNEKIVFHLHQSGSAALFLLSTLGLGVRKCTVFSMHTQYPALNTKNKLFNRITVALAERTVFVSSAAHDTYPQSMRNKKVNHIHTITNGVDSKRIELALVGADKTPNDMIELAYVARIIPLKNHDFLLGVLKRVDNTKLLLIGANDTSDFDRKVTEAGLAERVETMGLIPRDEVFRRIYQSDIYVSSSTIEGMPISVLEAMCCGLPILLSNIPPHTQITETGVGTALPFDENKWTEALTELVKMSNDERIALGNKCRQCAIDNFSLDSMHSKYDEIYNAIAK